MTGVLIAENATVIPLEAKPTEFWGNGFELEKSIFKNSSTLVNQLVKKGKNADENGDYEMLDTILKD